MTGWLADFFRFWWGLLYWNSRKSLFRLSPGRRQCPCQNPSDSGRAYETDCEAAQSWASPRRFRRVCPLLKETQDGLKCSVDAKEARPFWGRASAYLGTGFLATYLLAGLIAFGALRTIGYPVEFGMVLWPPRWHEFTRAKALFFFNKGSLELTRGNYREGTMALSLAYSIDPSHYETGLLLARFSTLLQPDRCDRIFAELTARSPEKAQMTAEYWLRSALARGSFTAMRDLALKRLAAGDQPSPPWFHALILSTRMLGDNDTLRQFLLRPESAEWRPVVDTELLIRTGQTAAAIRALNQIWYPKKPYFAYYQCRQLVRLGRPDDALLMGGTYRDLLPGSDQALIVLGAMAARGDRDRLMHEARTLLEIKGSETAAVELIAIHLVTMPNPELCAMVVDFVRQHPLPKDDASAKAYLSLFFAAGIVKDQAAVSYIQVLLKERSGSSLVTLTAAEEFLLDSRSLVRLESFLPALPISMDLAYALHERFSSTQQQGRQP